MTTAYLRRGPWDVSVVIPAYNRAHLLPATLDSILAQTRVPAEIIVIDDGSTDATPELMRRYSAPVRYHRIANGGVCRARNTGVRLATSPWVAFCDSDDLWHPDKLARQIRLLERVPGLSYVFADFVLLTGGGVEPQTKFERAPAGYWADGRRMLGDGQWVFDRPLYERLLRYQPIFPSTILMHRDFFERVGGIDERWTWTPAEDVEFALRCMQHAPVGAVALPLAQIRKHDGNFSRQWLDSSLGLAEIYRYARDHHLPMGPLHARQLDEQMRVEARWSLEAAFAMGRLDIVRRVRSALRPEAHTLKLRVKLAIADLPPPMAEPLARLLTSR